MTQRFDLFVIGTGSAGTTVAEQCRQAGWTVGIADELPFGGTCAQRGCDPKKVLVGAAEVAEISRRFFTKHMLDAAGQINWAQLIDFKRTFTDPVPQHIETWLHSIGITSYQGSVRFTGEQSLVIGKTEVEAEHILIATGSIPAPLNMPISGKIHTSDEFLNWDVLPKRLIFIGGGYISLEFAHIARSAGSQVTILHRGPQILPGFDPQMVEQLQRHSLAKGIDIHLNTEVTSIEGVSGQQIVHTLDTFHNVQSSFTADRVVHGAGRIPHLSHLHLERAHVPVTLRGVAVNTELQSVGNAHVYAAGDAADTPGLPLTPVAVMEGNFLAAHLLGNHVAPLDYFAIPTIVYTNPALARVGMLEEEARAKGYALQVLTADTTSWFSSKRILSPLSAFKVLIDSDTDKIIGAHVLGPHAEELINIFALAMRSGITRTELRHMPFAYPTGASDIPYMV
ncbi:dihydrolipoyl dehydrogenase family protein [Sulfobacillus thermosulfidooxidans]|uniref:dihydrolipoyl dehydrogenase family protein n=1 Tax=Sulfobacillus thermosulfidooxidans TaxID=28034 RepID=UPI0006B46C7C|nr:NAD(P)/FAD-dependent oxidoreductase [Sulfobacillus thermosulfidooxidans]